MVGNQLEADRKCCGNKTEFITLLKSKKNTRTTKKDEKTKKKNNEQGQREDPSWGLRRLGGGTAVGEKVGEGEGRDLM